MIVIYAVIYLVLGIAYTVGLQSRGLPLFPWEYDLEIRHRSRSREIYAITALAWPVLCTLYTLFFAGLVFNSYVIGGLGKGIEYLLGHVKPVVAKLHPYVGRRICLYEARGCMATERHNERYGKIFAVANESVYPGDRYLFASVKLDDGKIDSLPVANIHESEEHRGLLEHSW